MKSSAGVGAGGNPSHFNRGFHTTGTVGTFAASAAAGRLLNLSESKMVSALGIGGRNRRPLRIYGRRNDDQDPPRGESRHEWNPSPLPGQGGFTGPACILEDKRGFYKAFADASNPDRVVEGLGQTYEIMNTYVKYHASCRHSHAPLDAILDIRNRTGIRPRTLKSEHLHLHQSLPS